MSLVLGGLGGLLAEGLIGAAISDGFSKKNDKVFDRASKRAAVSKAQMKSVKERVEKSIDLLILRKYAVVSSSFPTFVDIVKKIQKVNFEEQDFPIAEVNQIGDSISEGYSSYFNISINENYDKKALVAAFLMGAITPTPAFLGFVLITSPIADAKKQESYNNIVSKEFRVYRQYTDTLLIGLECLECGIKGITECITTINTMFLKEMMRVKAIVERNGDKKELYSVDDKKRLTTLFNMASVLSNIISIPVIDKDNRITKSALDAMASCNDIVMEL